MTGLFKVVLSIKGVPAPGKPSIKVHSYLFTSKHTHYGSSTGEVFRQGKGNRFVPDVLMTDTGRLKITQNLQKKSSKSCHTVR